MAYIENGESALSIRSKMNEGLLVPATVNRSGTVLNITAPEGSKYIYFSAPSNYSSGDTYKINGVSYTLKSQFNTTLKNPWKSGAIVKLFLYNENIAYVDDQDAYTKEETITSSTLSSLGLSSTGTPDQAFTKLKTLVDTAQSTANKRPRVIAGAYTGKYYSGGSSPLEQTIELGAGNTPKAVLVDRQDGYGGNNNDVFRGLASEGCPAKKQGGTNAIEVTTNGFIVRGQEINRSNIIYNFLAIIW